jgi:hypothetical protein
MLLTPSGSVYCTATRFIAQAARFVGGAELKSDLEPPITRPYMVSIYHVNGSKKSPFDRNLWRYESPKTQSKAALIDKAGSVRLDDAGDTHRRVRLPVASFPSHILTSTELLNDDLLGAELVDDGRDHLGAGDHRSSECQTRRPPGDQQDRGKNDLVARVSRAVVDVDVIPFADPELVASVLKNRVHPSGLLRWTQAFIPGSGTSDPEHHLTHDSREDTGAFERSSRLVNKGKILISRLRKEKSSPWRTSAWSGPERFSKKQRKSLIENRLRLLTKNPVGLDALPGLEYQPVGGLTLASSWSIR